MDVPTIALGIVGDFSLCNQNRKDFLTYFLILTLFSLTGTCWYFDRNKLKQDNLRVHSAFTKISEERIRENNEKCFYISERDKLELIKWLGDQAFIRTVHRYRNFKELGTTPSFKNLDEAIDYELVQLVSYAFELEEILDRLELFPDAAFVAHSALRYLDCEDYDDFSIVANNLGFNSPRFPQFDYFFNKQRPEHQKFLKFLEKCSRNHGHDD